MSNIEKAHVSFQQATDLYEREMINQTAMGAQSKRGAKTSPFTQEVNKINHIFSIAEDILVQK